MDLSPNLWKSAGEFMSAYDPFGLSGETPTPPPAPYPRPIRSGIFEFAINELAVVESGESASTSGNCIV